MMWGHAVEKPADTFRVVVLGDSFIEALQVPIDDGFCRQLQTRLQGYFTEKPVEVINLALSGRGPAQYYRILEKKGLQYHPDLVVMAVLPANDFQDSSFDLNPAPYKPLYRINDNDDIELLPYSIPSSGSIRSLLQRSSMAYFLVYEILKRPFFGKIFTKAGLIPRTTPDEKFDVSAGKQKLPVNLGLYMSDPPQVWRDAYRITLRMIRASKDLAKANEAHFLAFSIPDKEAVEDEFNDRNANYNGIALDYRKPFKTLFDYCETHDIDFLDLTEVFRKDFRVNGVSHTWPHDGHWNPRGHAIAAKAVSEYIRTQIEKWQHI